MRYHNITKDDMKNGDGLRAVLWLAGCPHRCPGCHNPVTWDENGGLEFDGAAEKEIFDQLLKKLSGSTPDICGRIFAVLRFLNMWTSAWTAGLRNR